MYVCIYIYIRAAMYRHTSHSHIRKTHERRASANIAKSLTIKTYSKTHQHRQTSTKHKTQHTNKHTRSYAHTNLRK